MRQGWRGRGAYELARGGSQGPSQHVAVQRRVVVFLGLVHMLRMVPNLVFLFMSPPLIPFGLCSSYQLLIRFLLTAEAAGRREGKGRKENPSVAKMAERPEGAKGTGGRHLRA
jgi:hypothetical protein